MRDALRPRLHLFVCANRRDGSPLGPGCSEHGDQVYDALKREVAARGDITRTWVTRTHCLGICPKLGATVARYGEDAGPGSPIVTEVGRDDAARLLDVGAAEAPGLDRALARELEALETLQRRKVLELARRLRPGLTLEDVQNPHDFPELADPDWHYADGVLAGIASVKSALAALTSARRSE